MPRELPLDLGHRLGKEWCGHRPVGSVGQAAQQNRSQFQYNSIKVSPALSSSSIVFIDLAEFDIEDVHRFVAQVLKQRCKCARKLVVDQKPHDTLMSA